MIIYAQARADHEYLWKTYGPADDMTGGYVDQDDLAKLLKNPTKRVAAHCYHMQIVFWFQSPPYRADLHEIHKDSRVEEIRERHICGIM